MRNLRDPGVNALRDWRPVRRPPSRGAIVARRPGFVRRRATWFLRFGADRAGAGAESARRLRADSLNEKVQEGEDQIRRRWDTGDLPGGLAIAGQAARHEQGRRRGEGEDFKGQLARRRRPGRNREVVGPGQCFRTAGVLKLWAAVNRWCRLPAPGVTATVRWLGRGRMAATALRRLPLAAGATVPLRRRTARAAAATTRAVRDDTRAVGAALPVGAEAVEVRQAGEQGRGRR